MERHTRSYIQLIKPGITLSNTITAVAGYLFAAGPKRFEILTFLAVTAGVALVIASACVVNNIFDKDIDRKMKRTRYREIAAGNIPIAGAYVYAVLLGAIGLTVLLFGTNILTTLLGVVAFLWYVFVYGLAKRRTPLSTIIGAVCGALPPVAGYTAVTNQIDTTAWLLFALLLTWQLPHFYAIAIFRHDDYKKAGLPVWSVRYGLKTTKAQIMFWIVSFFITILLFFSYSGAGIVFLISMLIASSFWMLDGLLSYKKLSGVDWAKRSFGISLFELILLAAAIGSDRFLPWS